MIKRILLCAMFALGYASTQAQPADPTAPWADPTIASVGKAKPRHEFISYTIRDLAEKGDPMAADHYLPLEGKWHVNYGTTKTGGKKEFYRPMFSVAQWARVDVPNFYAGANVSPFEGLVPPQLPAEIPLVQYRAEIDVPYLWLDRDLFIHIEGVGGAYSLFINDKKVGYGGDTRTPAEFNISDAVTDGLNSIGIEVYGFSTGGWMETGLAAPTPGSLGRVYLYSQPKLCIHDFVVTTRLDSAGVNALVGITVLMSNSYRNAERITLGYDIYSPDGKLLTYNLLETTVEGNSLDTLYFKEYIYPSSKKMWTPASPALYKMMFYTRREQRITEYIPYRLGLNVAELRAGEIYIGDKKVPTVAVEYNALPSAKETEEQLITLKKNKVNMLCVDYPQPRWFYEMCDRVGFYIVDQANVNSAYRTQDRNVGGAVANDRRFLPEFIDRITLMQGRSKNYPSVVATSMGGVSGQGYNLYKSYQTIKKIDTLHPVLYRDLQGEWNADAVFPTLHQASEFLQATSAKKPTRR